MDDPKPEQPRQDAAMFATWLVELLIGNGDIDEIDKVWIDPEFPTDLHVHTQAGERFYIKVEDEL